MTDGTKPKVQRHSNLALLRVFFGNYAGWFASFDQSVSSVTFTTYTTFSAAYGESGSITGTQAMPQTNLISSSFTVSSTTTTTDNSSNSLTTTVLAPSGMFTLTMTDTTTSTFSGNGTTSMTASQTNTAGVTNETVGGGTSGWYSANYTTTQNGATAQTITTASSSSIYTDTYTPSGATFSGGGSFKGTTTTYPGSSVTTSSYASTYNYTVTGAGAPSMTTLLGSIGAARLGLFSGGRQQHVGVGGRRDVGAFGVVVGFGIVVEFIRPRWVVVIVWVTVVIEHDAGWIGRQQLADPGCAQCARRIVASGGCRDWPDLCSGRRGDDAGAGDFVERGRH